MNAPAYQIDGAEVDRAAFYATACDPRQSIVVEACAGAGKTWMLVSRILRALLEGAEPQQILAITFTRKAAGEMRERLADWLAGFSNARSTHEDRVKALRERGLDASNAERLAPALGRLHERVLASGRPVQVRTFHAWFAQLLRMAPLEVLREMGLSPGMGLIEDPEELRPELLRRFQRKVAGNESLRIAYGAIVARQGRNTLTRWLDAAWSRAGEIERADAAGTLAGSVPPASAVFNDCAGHAHPLDRWETLVPAHWLEGLARALGAVEKTHHQTAAARLREALDAPTPALAFERAWKAVHTDEGTLRKLSGVPPEFAELSDTLSTLDEQIKQQDAHEDHSRMVLLSRALLAEYAALKRDRALVDMGDLERVALQLLGEGEWAGWIQERLDARLKHLLIDEFQDTSPLQWHALRPWLEAYAGAGGGASGREPLAVFIVGDPKQSIYRFRRAEPRVFAAAGEFIAEALGGRRLACDHTRRNAPSLLAALNSAFEKAQDEGAYEGFRPHTTEVTDNGEGVFALPRDPKPPVKRNDKDAPLEWRDSLTVPRLEEEERRSAEEARYVAAAIAELLAGGAHPPGSIQVLARRRNILGLLSDELRALHIPHALPNEIKLAEEPEARDLIALLDALASPGHDLSLAQALKSPVFEASDADLLWLAGRARAQGSWWAALQAAGEGAPPALTRAAPLLARWAETARMLPPHDLFDRVLHEGDVEARVLRASLPERRGHARVVLDAVLAQTLALDGGRYTTLYRFVRALKSGWLTASVAAEGDAVKLLTVHGAKGLESDIVFVMDTDPEALNPESGSLLVDWPVHSAHPAVVAFVGRWARLAPSLQPLRDEEARQSAREELNGLYVAVTRTRRRLVISSIEPRRKSSPIAWWDRLVGLAQPWAPASPERQAAQGRAEAIEVVAWPEPVFGARVPRAAPARVLASADTRATLMGEAFHRVMQWSTGRDVGEVGVWLDEAVPAAAAEFGLDTAEASYVRRAAHAVLGSAICAPLLRGPRIAWAGDEVPIAEGGAVLRIDRLVALRPEGGETPRTWWVLDYKLEPRPQDNPENRAQMARYRRAVAALQPGEAVRAAFITARGELVEIPGEQGEQMQLVFS